MANAPARTRTGASSSSSLPRQRRGWTEKHTVFGNVTSGMDVVDRISEAERDDNDRPANPVAIERVELPQDD